MSQRANRGSFKPGPDARRHQFTREECALGYQRAMESLDRRFPGCDPHFLMCAITGAKPWYTLINWAEVPADA